MLPLITASGHKFECINCWAECSTKTFQLIVKEWEPTLKMEQRNPVLLFSILTGLKFDEVLQSRDSEIELAIYQCTAFVYNEPMTFKDEQTEVIKLRGKLISVPKKLEALTVKQNMLIRQAMVGVTSLEEIISLACAVYLQPLVDGGTYDHEKALELEKEILELPIWQTFAVGFFYLSKLNNSGRSGLLSWSRLKRVLARYAIGLQNMQTLKGLNHSTNYQ